MTEKTSQQRHLNAVGARILSEANDLKRTVEALAEDIQYDLDEVRAVVAGNAGLEQARRVIQAMSDTYPISLADLWVEPDDTDKGVCIMSATDSKKSSRIFKRSLGNGGKSDYYEYRDTAMSNASPFKPEWIQPIRIVDTPDPDNSNVAYNKGHLMHQLTFFIGEVNFYWRRNGKNYSAEMNTGDSNYITPFVPHSFTSRNPEKPGLIVAVTFGGEVRKALDEFSRIGANAADFLAGNSFDTNAIFKTRLKRYLAAETMAPGDLSQRLQALGIASCRADKVSAAKTIPTTGECECLAAALNVKTEDLLPTPIQTGSVVQVLHVKDRKTRTYPDGNDYSYRLSELVRFPHLPLLKGFDVTVSANLSSAPAEICHGLHQYIYNYAEFPVTIRWDGERSATLGPGDSAHILPMVAHTFVSAGNSGDEDARLLVVRVPGALNDAVLSEFSIFSSEGRHRVAGEDQQWF